MNFKTIIFILFSSLIISYSQAETIVVDVHFLLKDDGTGNFSPTSDNAGGATGYSNGYTFASALISKANELLNNNIPPNFPVGNTDASSININLKLATVLFHYNTTEYNRIGNDETGLSMLSDEYLFSSLYHFNIFIYSYTSKTTASGHATTCNDKRIDMIGFWNNLQSGGISLKGLALEIDHELAHSLCLNHVFGAQNSAVHMDDCDSCDVCPTGNDGIDDTPLWEVFKEAYGIPSTVLSCNRYTTQDIIHYNNLVHQGTAEMDVSLTDHQINTMHNTLYDNDKTYIYKLCVGDRTAFETINQYYASKELYACLIGNSSKVTIASGQTSVFKVNDGIIKSFHAQPGSSFKMTFVNYCPNAIITNTLYTSGNYFKKAEEEIELKPIDSEIHKKDMNVSVYPNPSNGVFNIRKTDDNETLWISLLDLSGKVIKTDNFIENDYQLNLSELNSGIYFLIVKSNKGTNSYKLVRQ